MTLSEFIDTAIAEAQKSVDKIDPAAILAGQGAEITIRCGVVVDDGEMTLVTETDMRSSEITISVPLHIPFIRNRQHADPN